MQLPSFSRNDVQRRGLVMLIVVPFVALVLFLLTRSSVLIWSHIKDYSIPEILGTSFIAIFLLMLVWSWEPWASSLRASIGKRLRSFQPLVKLLCLLILFPLFSSYFLTGGEAGSVPATLQAGFITVALALGGLVFNAGLNLDGESGRELILVGQKFIAAVILVLIFSATVHIVGIAENIDVSSFEPGDLTAWGRGVTFWVATTSFSAGVGLFVIALVDLAYSVFGLGGKEHATQL